MNKSQGRLIVVSNRLPVTIESAGTEASVHSSDGGLVTALSPILSQTGGSWIGWMGDIQDESLAMSLTLHEDYSLQPVFLTAAEKDCYYHGFSNEIIWPLFHGLPSRCKFMPDYWHGYCSVNEKFAQVVARVSEPEDFIWVHDYHLMLQAQALGALGFRQPCAYFHHIPFPSPDVFEKLPWRNEILRALMNFSCIGFQTSRDRNNFVACVTHCLPESHVNHVGQTTVVASEGHATVAGAYPISIDYEAISAEASDPSTISIAQTIRRKVGSKRIILGVDRLDYTKGILERLIAFRALLEHHPELRDDVTLLQFVSPSREAIPEYKDLKLGIEILVSEINGRYSTPGWVPVHYFYRTTSRSELVNLYRAADVALVTPLKDGMNLVAKEFCASRPDLQGVLILSEFAGAADELKCGALLVNPHDVESLANTLQQALEMDESEQLLRMSAMRSQIRMHDVFRWAESFKIYEGLEATPRVREDDPLPKAACS